MNTTSPSATTIPEFSTTRTFNTPGEQVWRAWTEESELAQWLRPFGVSTDSTSFDVWVGGHYAYAMTNDETGEKFPTGGVFLEGAPIGRLVFTLGEPGAAVEITPFYYPHLQLTGPQPQRTAVSLARVRRETMRWFRLRRLR